MRSGAFTCRRLLPSRGALVRACNYSHGALQHTIDLLIDSNCMRAVRKGNIHGVCHPGRGATFAVKRVRAFGRSTTEGNRGTRARITLFARLYVDGGRSTCAKFPTNTRMCCVRHVRCLRSVPLVVGRGCFLGRSIPKLATRVTDRSVCRCLRRRLRVAVIGDGHIVAIRGIARVSRGCLRLGMGSCGYITIISDRACGDSNMVFRCARSQREPSRFQFCSGTLHQ